jgi:hypothetical protein
MIITRIKGADLETIAEKIKSTYKKIGYDMFVSIEGKKIRLSTIRLGDKWISKAGYNISPYTGRSGRVLNWDNWVHVNNTINKILDRLKVSANVSSLSGTFKIREGKKKFTKKDWQEHAYENVGSMVEPVYRIDAWQPRNPKKFKKLLRSVI